MTCIYIYSIADSAYSEVQSTYYMDFTVVTFMLMAADFVCDYFHSVLVVNHKWVPEIISLKVELARA